MNNSEKYRSHVVEYYITDHDRRKELMSVYEADQEHDGDDDIYMLVYGTYLRSIDIVVYIYDGVMVDYMTCKGIDDLKRTAELLKKTSEFLSEKLLNYIELITPYVDGSIQGTEKKS